MELHPELLTTAEHRALALCGVLGVSAHLEEGELNSAASRTVPIMYLVIIQPENKDMQNCGEVHIRVESSKPNDKL